METCHTILCRLFGKILQSILWLIIVVILLATLLLFWINLEPRNLDNFRPQINSVIEEFLPNTEFSYDKILLTSTNFAHDLRINIQGINIADKDNAITVKNGNAQLGFKPLDFLMLRFQPSDFIVHNSQVLIGDSKSDDDVEFNLDKTLKGLAKYKNITLKDVSVKFADWHLKLHKFTAKLSKYKGANKLVSYIDLNNVINGNIGAIFDRGNNQINLIVDAKKFNFGLIGNTKNKNDIGTLELDLSTDYDLKNTDIKAFNYVSKDNVKISGNGNLELEDYQFKQGNIKLDIYDIPYNRLPSFWLKDVASGARNWILKHVKGGALSHVKIDLYLNQKTIEQPVIPKEDGSVTFNYSDLKVKVNDKLPVLFNVSGDGKYQGNKVDFNIDKAQFGTSKLSNTKVKITDLEGAGNLQANTQITGPAHDAINVKRQVTGKGIINTIEGIKGSYKTSLDINIPLNNSELVQYKLKGSFSNLSLPLFADYYSINNASLKHNISNKNISIKGDGNVTINGNSPALSLGDKQVVYNANNIPTNFDINISGKKHKYIIDADITDVALNSPDNGIIKTQNEPAKLSLNLDGKDIKNLTIKGDQINVKGRVDFANNGTLQQANFEHIKIGQNDFSIKYKTSPKLAAEITGKKAYLAELLNQLKSSSSDGPGRSGAVKVKLDEVVLYNKQSLSDFFASILLESGNITSGKITGRHQYGKQTNIDIIRLKDGNNILVNSDNAGAILRALNYFNDGYKGNLQASLKLLHNYDINNGKLLLQDFRLKNVPILSQLLNLASFSGLADTLRGKGIKFDNIRSDFEVINNILQIKNMRAASASTGFTASGTINLNNKKVDISGVLVPAYSINSFLNDIPIINEVLVGGDGEGIIGVTYTIKGTLDNPDIMANPLSALTPGFMRNIFE